MKFEVKKLTLVVAAGICGFSGVHGAAEEARKTNNSAELASVDIKKIPKFNKVQIINDIKDKEYEVEVYVNESLPDPEIKSMEARTKKPGAAITFPGEAWVSSFRLVLKDKTNIFDSGEQLVEWAGPRAKKAEILNIFGEKLEGVNVFMEIKKDMLIITVKKGSEGEKKADKAESDVKDKSSSF